MSRFYFVLRSFIHYRRANLIVAVGIIISTAVLTGGLIIGDSVKFSLLQITKHRLGQATHTINAGDRFFTLDLAKSVGTEGIISSTVLLSKAVAVAEGGENRVNKVQIAGIDSSFAGFMGSDLFTGMGRNEVIISQNLSQRLSVKPGDQILLRIQKESLIPMNAPFVSNEETYVPVTVTVKAVASVGQGGGFSLKNAQSTPFNVFVDIRRLNEWLGFTEKANTILLSTKKQTSDILKELKNRWEPADAGLSFREMDGTNETEILSERVFIDPPVYDAFGTLPGARNILTYFANSIEPLNGSATTPYSFISTLSPKLLKEDEIFINEWTADDLGVKPGDSIRLRYFVVGPLRQLEEKSAVFVLKKIVAMDDSLSDPTLMPFLPGLSDAGSCRDWEAGVPIDLDKIRDKDEDYWNRYRGTPKAFVSMDKAGEIWGNRFGNYTSVRFDKNKFSKRDFETFFRDRLQPESLGFVVLPVKEQGEFAASSGVSFSQLFIGLSFFLLVAAILLSALLYLLHIESRRQQIATLTSLGFKPSQVQNLLVSENIILGLVGGLLGVLMAVVYTRIVFAALNTLWNDIVRTNLLAIKLVPSTLFIGFAVGLLISILVGWLVIRKKLKQQVAEIRRKPLKKEHPLILLLKVVIASVFTLLSAGIVISQIFWPEGQNQSLFFISGGLMLAALLLFTDRFLREMEFKRKETFTLSGFYMRNLVRNRSRSLTVVVLFAIGTFLVISTGSNKKDLFINAGLKSSGTGGFSFFAETTIPILFDLNDPAKRSEESLAAVGQIVQCMKIDGDDASCLNLNRIANPAILGVAASELEGRFTFVSSIPELDKSHPWFSLDTVFADGSIPAIADQTVIQWGLGKKAGDVLSYINERGDTLRLKLVGGLAPSIFQGYVIIGSRNFLKEYPSHSGSSVFLAESDPGKTDEADRELSFAFRDYGWEPERAAQKLAEFNSVTNTYLSIFLALGALALILGTIGLAVVVARDIENRTREIALAEAVGFSKEQVFNSLFREYSLLLVAGLMIGLLTAVMATLPSFLSSGTDVSFRSILFISTVILVNGLGWIAALAWFPLRKRKLASFLSEE